MIKRLLLGVILNGSALYLIAYALDGVTYEGGWKFLLVGGILIGILNTIIKPLLKLVTLPLVFFTAGLFLVVINGVILYLFKYLIDVIDISGISFEVAGLKNYATASLLFGIINWLEHLLLKKD